MLGDTQAMKDAAVPMQESILIVGPEGTILDLSPEAEALLESGRESLVGKRAQDLVEPLDLSRAMRKFQAALNRRERELKGAVRLRGRRAADAWVQVRVNMPPASSVGHRFVVALKKLSGGIF